MLMFEKLNASVGLLVFQKMNSYPVSTEIHNITLRWRYLPWNIEKHYWQNFSDFWDKRVHHQDHQHSQWACEGRFNRCPFAFYGDNDDVQRLLNVMFSMATSQMLIEEEDPSLLNAFRQTNQIAVEVYLLLMIMLKVAWTYEWWVQAFSI